jgi:diguanylate cyclase (GGDEF)-like protein
MRDYCRSLAPSSEYLRPVLAAIFRLDVENVVTRSGSMYGRSALSRFIAELSAVEFFNAPRTIDNPSEKREFSHAALATQVLFKLESAYGRDDVLATFADSGLVVKPETLEFDDSIPHDFRLWQRVFDIVYAKKGAPWLAVVEPLVDKLVILYGVVKPAVYHSEIAQAEKKAEEIDSARRDLEARLSSLEERLADTLDRMSHDDTSGVYNEMFLRQYLAGLLTGNENSPSEADPALFLVAIDDVSRLNAKYSKATGDEAIRNLGYLLDRIRRPEDILARRNGPGYALCLASGGSTAAQQMLTRIRADVRSADVFIEPLTVSAAFIRFAERPRDESVLDSVEAMLSIADSRLRIALDRGPSAFVDEHVRIEGIRSGRVLLVDDDPAALQLLAILLRSQNYDVTTASDGAIALEAARTQRFDCVICERNVPKLDGFALRQELYSDGGTAPSLFILTTYHKSRETVVRANQAGVDAVLAKPVIFEEIDGIIRRAARKNGISR